MSASNTAIPDISSSNHQSDRDDLTERKVYTGMHSSGAQGDGARQPNPPQTSDVLNIPLHEERLIIDKTRVKTGAISVRKQIVKETTETSVPIYKEKIIIEIESILGATQVNLCDRDVQAEDSEDIYAERLRTCKEPMVRQHVTIRKEVNTDVISVSKLLRREELEIHAEGQPDVSDRS